MAYTNRLWLQAQQVEKGCVTNILFNGCLLLEKVDHVPPEWLFRAGLHIGTGVILPLFPATSGAHTPFVLPPTPTLSPTGTPMPPPCELAYWEVFFSPSVS